MTLAEKTVVLLIFGNYGHTGVREAYSDWTRRFFWQNLHPVNCNTTMMSLITSGAWRTYDVHDELAFFLNDYWPEEFEG